MPVAKLALDFSGMVTAPGKIQAPPGALTLATNVNFPAPGIAEKRRGFSVRSRDPLTSGAAWKMYSSPLLGSQLLLSNGAGGATPLYGQANRLSVGDPVSGWTAITTPGNALGNDVVCDYNRRARITAHGQTHYGTSQRASWRLSSSTTLAWAGMPRPTGFHFESGTTLVTATGGFLPVGSAVAYRIVWTLPNSGTAAPIVSAPSGRFVVMNVNGTPGHANQVANVTLRVLVPKVSDAGDIAISTAWKYQLYRTRVFDTTTGQPDDEMQLVYEGSPAAGDITTGWLDLADVTPAGVGGAFLYTNTTLGGDVSTGAIVPGSSGITGILASNDRPPIARDVATFADCVVYGNVTTPQRMTFSLLAVGSTANVLKATDVLQFSGTTAFSLTASSTAAANPNAGTFQVFTGYSSLSLNIRQTAINLCAAINGLAANTWLTATYIGNDTLPGTVGQILLENRNTNAGAFTFNVTTGSSLPYAPQPGLTSSAEVRPNYLAVSKPGLPDAVPPANYIQVGPSDGTILALVSLRDALFIFTDRGLYWMRGATPSQFVIESFDLTFRLWGTEFATTCADAIYAWGREGIAEISNGGLKYIDLPIRNLVQQAVRGLDAAFPVSYSGASIGFADVGFATAYRTERRVLFFFKGGAEVLDDGTTADPFGCRYAFVWNVATGGWSQYSYDNKQGKTCSTVRYSDELMQAGDWNAGTAARTYSETNNQFTSDFVDKGRSGSSSAILSAIEWTTQAPDPAAINHWREVQFYLNATELISAFKLPTACILQLATELGEVTGTFDQTTTFTPTVEQCRILCEPAVSMATRMVVRIRHEVANDYFCLGGWALVYSPVSTFNTR